jgi:hypothetical protein
MNRRLFLAGAGALLAAPAIVRASSLMALPAPRPRWHDGGFLFGEPPSLVGEDVPIDELNTTLQDWALRIYQQYRAHPVGMIAESRLSDDGLVITATITDAGWRAGWRWEDAPGQTKRRRLFT